MTYHKIRRYKKTLNVLFALLSFSFLSITTSNAEPVDLSEQAQIAESKGKLLMLVLMREDCSACDELLNVVNNKQVSSGIHEQFYIVQSITNEDFGVVCPDGLELSGDEFQYMKGVTILPALVFTDTSGNVVYRYHGEATSKSLQAMAQFIKQRAYLDGLSFEQWQQQQQYTSMR